MKPAAFWSLFITWLGLGARSWGGGAATLLMIRREAVERQGWLSDEEFTRYWAICQITPGINLLGLTTLLGWRVGRGWGATIALLGLLLPSVAITAAITALYAGVRELPAMQAALKGVIPATIGFGLLLSWQMGAPLLRQAAGEGRRNLIVAGGLMTGAFMVELLWRPPVIVVLLGAGALGALYAWWEARRTTP